MLDVLSHFSFLFKIDVDYEEKSHEKIFDRGGCCNIFGGYLQTSLAHRTKLSGGWIEMFGKWSVRHSDLAIGRAITQTTRGSKSLHG